jgi:Methyltransferase domain
MKLLRTRAVISTVLAAVLCAGLLPADLRGQAPSKTAAKAELTIRNLTREDIDYTLSRLYDAGPTAKHTIRPDGLDRVACSTGLDIGFSRGGQTVSYRLDCGMAYTFRYDENDRLELYSGSHGLFGVADLAPYVPTPAVVIDKMLALAKVGPGDVLYDLGCGDGRIVITAAKMFGTKGVGIDLDPRRIEESNAGARAAGVENLVEFRVQDVMKADFSAASVVTLYLLPESNNLLRPLLEAQLKPGTRVVSHNYSIPGWQSKETGYATLQDDKGQDHTIYVYKR